MVATFTYTRDMEKNIATLKQDVWEQQKNCVHLRDETKKERERLKVHSTYIYT